MTTVDAIEPPVADPGLDAYNARRFGFAAGVAVGMVIVGGGLGRVYGARPEWKRAAWIVVGVWLVFGLLVYTIAGAGPFGSRLQAGVVWHAVTLLGVFAIFGAALHEMFWLLSRRVATRVSAARRLLLRNAALALVATLGVGVAWRVLIGGRQMGAES